MPTAACYVRVSTEHQRENYSIAEQTDRLTAFCAAKDITIGRIYTDGGYSGGTLRRPATAGYAVPSPEYDVVIVYKLDRLSRSQKDTLLLIEDYFLAKQVDFISVCENFDTSTPLGRAMIGMLSVFAQLEKEQITERFTMGRLAPGKKRLLPRRSHCSHRLRLQGRPPHRQRIGSRTGTRTFRAVPSGTFCLRLPALHAGALYTLDRVFKKCTPK